MRKILLSLKTVKHGMRRSEISFLKKNNLNINEILSCFFPFYPFFRWFNYLLKVQLTLFNSNKVLFELQRE